MHGYEVVTSDDRVVGRVADVRNDFLIVESGRLRKSQHPVPREFVHVVDEAAKVFVTVPRRVLMDAPRVEGEGAFDQTEAARYFGLAESYVEPPTEGEGELLAHDPAWGSDRDATAAGQPAPEQRRAEMREQMQPGVSEEQHPSSTALFGNSRRAKGD